MEIEKPSWSLVWADEFEYEGLPDPIKWSYEEGFVRNEEKQFYTRGRLENSRVGGGVLTIEGRKEAWQYTGVCADYTSASITTQGRFDCLYGRIEVRASLPEGRGVWPAIWMLGSNHGNVPWPHCGEIDIMEYVGHTPQTIWANIHFAKHNEHTDDAGKVQLDELTTDFHVYAIEWSRDSMDFYVDDRKYHTCDLSAADNETYDSFRKPHYLILNLALGGTWGGEIDDAILPQRFVVDYVRVYQSEALTRL